METLKCLDYCRIEHSCPLFGYFDDYVVWLETTENTSPLYLSSCRVFSLKEKRVVTLIWANSATKIVKLGRYNKCLYYVWSY